jgi:hypothetical protein
MEHLPDDVCIHLASFYCAYELSLVNKRFNSLIHTNAKTSVIDREWVEEEFCFEYFGTHDVNDIDEDFEDDIQYIEIITIYEIGKLRCAERIIEEYIERYEDCHWPDPVWGVVWKAISFESILHGNCIMWDKCDESTSISDMVQCGFQKILDHHEDMEDEE